jgi:hypothetical protein
MYFYGDGVAQDPPTAVTWFTKAADHGHPDAQFNLAVMYFTGEVVAKNTAKAAELFTKSAEKGKVAAQLNLGMMYQAGDGVPKDLVQAYMWADIAASTGNSDAARFRAALDKALTLDQINEAKRQSREWKPK